MARAGVLKAVDRGVKGTWTIHSGAENHPGGAVAGFCGSFYALLLLGAALGCWVCDLDHKSINSYVRYERGMLKYAHEIKGGASTSHGGATVWAGRDGLPKTIAYAPRGGHLSNGAHAMFVARVGDYRIRVSTARRQVDEIMVHRVVAVGGALDGVVAVTLRPVCSFAQGEWDFDPPAFLSDAVAACERKACAYHCRAIYFGKAREAREAREAWR